MLTLEEPKTSTVYLGPAMVLQPGVGRMKLRVDNREIWAVSGVCFPYQASAGDVVLTIQQSDEWYVIGVLKAVGATVFTVPGDLEIRAPRGRIAFVAGHEVEMRAAEVRVAAHRLELVAKTVLERFSDVTRWVSNTFQLRAARFRTRVDGTWNLKAERIVERADKDVKIDGEKIRLG
jgi:hypothetical protein